MTPSSEPNTRLEQEYWSNGLHLVAGVDEVGRGCLAGPVVAAACILPAGVEPLVGIRDSKMLSVRQRREHVQTIRDIALATAVGAASRQEIDALNIRVASMLAMRRALAHLGPWQRAIIDGPLFAEFADGPYVGVIDADATCLSVSCASILAKEARDALMCRLAQRHPEFGWDHNAGYGTAEHLDALRRLGPTPHHRRSFRPVRELIEATMCEPGSKA
ncbi:MAG TPA: ribonuclease HII [Nitrolancea sp.]|nr:ribonuclease HII [Nitrolancea sp.]